MKSRWLLLWMICAAGCFSTPGVDGLILKKELPKELKEISGIISVGNDVWAISDKPHPEIFRLNKKANIVQEVKIKNAKVSDVEAITSDGTFLYVGDVGDNEGTRDSRTILKVALKDIRQDKMAEVSSGLIEFTFSDESKADKKKDNDFDCESVLATNDKLYLFTKRRTDDQCELYVIPNRPGKYVAKLIAKYDTKGLITDAAINPAKNVVALTGYEKGHEHPFVLLLKNFSGDNFFSGNVERIELTKKKKEWQIEGITFKNNKVVYFSCEETKNVPATLYEAPIKSLNDVGRKD